jgi:hypothetical protein
VAHSLAIAPSQPIVSTAPTHHDPAPPALEYKFGQPTAALLTAVGASAEGPVVVFARVVAPLVLHLLLHQPLVPPGAEARSSGIAVDNGRGAGVEPIPVPLLVAARLLAEASRVVEMRPVEVCWS